MVKKKGELGKYEAFIRYKDCMGVSHRHHKRGFRTKRERDDYVHVFREVHEGNLNIGIQVFLPFYVEDIETEIKPKTLQTKKSLISCYVLPFFDEATMSNIDPHAIRQWKSWMKKRTKKNGEHLAPTTLRNAYKALYAIFEHAVKEYGLKENPCKAAGSMGETYGEEMLFWTLPEYVRFACAIEKAEPLYFLVFEVLFWMGIRFGELLALTWEDIDFEACTMRINKSLQRIEGIDYVTEPKTKYSKRVLEMAVKLVEELKAYRDSLYSWEPTDRVFPLSRWQITERMKKYSEKAGVKRIRIHDLRHSHATYLIGEGFTVPEIANRLGQAKETITLRYTHAKNDAQKRMAKNIEGKMRRISDGDSFEIETFAREVTFGMSYEEYELLQERIRLSGMQERDYYLSSVLYQQIQVVGNTNMLYKLAMLFADIERNLSEHNVELSSASLARSLHEAASLFRGMGTSGGEGPDQPMELPEAA